jgi:hypothetical protein
MRTSLPSDPLARLMPEGRRWGFGAHSVLPYLTVALQLRPADAGQVLAGIRNPVFPQMDEALRAITARPSAH